MKILSFGLLCLCLPALTFSQQFGKKIPIATNGASTYYVDGKIEGFGAVKMLVDTGSGYTVINEQTLTVLQGDERTVFIKDLQGIMADGSRMIVPVYRIAAIGVGGDCWIHDVEVAVFPEDTRPILGLSALRKVSPFVFSLDDSPSLMLSNCQGGRVAADMSNLYSVEESNGLSD